MSDIDLTTYKDLYLTTAYEYLNALDMNLPKLLGKSPDRQLMDTVLIAAHSLKSQSYVMKYITIGQLCALMEKRLLILKDQPQDTLDAGMIAALKECASTVRKAVDNIKAGQPEGIDAADVSRFEQTIGVAAPNLS